MRIILLGAPGAGKGTQAQFICDAYSIPLISTGEILRHAVRAGTEIGKAVKRIMDSGKLVSDDIILSIIRDRLMQPDCKGGFLFDGFPRTIPQAEALMKIGVRINHVIEIAVPDDELVKRLTGRRVHPASGRSYHVIFNPPKVAGKDDVTGEALVQRDDDNEVSVRKRLEVYHKQTQPLIEFYQEAVDQHSTKSASFASVDGQGTVEIIRNRIFEVLGRI